MFLSPFYSEKQGLVAVSAHQASRFAKTIASDFNPIHDVAARRFCVPGDLLFALVVDRLGVHENMNFQFLGTVGADVGISIPATSESAFDIVNDKGKAVVNVQVAGESTRAADFCENLTREYVAFSGQNFPHILVPLMAEKGVMINPARPLVMYESMVLDFDTLAGNDVALRLSRTSLDVEGKRGEAMLHFDVLDGDRSIGRGYKKLALGGLQPYDQVAMGRVIADYEAKKAAYLDCAESVSVVAK